MKLKGAAVVARGLGGRVIAHHPQCNAEDGVLVYLDQPVKGIEMAFEAQLDELLFVR